MRAATLILEPHKPMGGFLGMRGPAPREIKRRIRTMGDGTSWAVIEAGGGTPSTYPVPVSTGVIEASGGTPIPAGSVDSSSSLSDLLYNAATGDVSNEQEQNLISQESAALQQAGMNPTDAAAQAASDVNTTLTTYTGPGAFGIVTTGAAPGQGWVASLGSALGGIDLSNIPGWAWLAIGGLGIYLAVKVIRK
jgi:hypothetical protein